MEYQVYLIREIEIHPMPKVNRNGQATVLSVEQLHELWDELNHPHRLITQICYYTAARVGEVCSLQVEDVVKARLFIVPGILKRIRPGRWRSPPKRWFPPWN